MKGSLLTPTADGGEVAEGVNAGVAADPTADEVGSTRAMDDASLLATAFAEAVAASGLDADDSPVAAPTAGLNDDAKWDQYPLGQLPDENGPDVPPDTMAGGLRSIGGTLASLFEIGVVGKHARDVHWRHRGVNMDEQSTRRVPGRG
jgi:hypothetical protein